MNSTINYNDDKLERFIPIAFSELKEEIIKLNISNCNDVENLAKSLRSYYHKDFYNRLLEAKRYYHLFNPDRDTVSIKEYTKEEKENLESIFIEKIVPLLNSANYERLNQLDINKAIEETSPYGVDVKVNFDEFDKLFLFFRGSAKKIEKRRTIKTLFLKKELIETLVYRRLFLLFKQKIDEKEYIYLKLFKDIPQSDLEMLFPNIKVKIALIDKIKLSVTGGGGTAAGAMSLFGKLSLALEPVALVSAIGAFGALIGRQIMSVFNHRTKYMAKLSKNLYYYNLDNNAGAISHLFDMAEDEESKEVFLAYMFLLQNNGLTKEHLDKKIESFINDTFNIPMDFEIEDAIEKLLKLQLIRYENNKMLVMKIEDAIKLLNG